MPPRMPSSSSSSSISSTSTTKSHASSIVIFLFLVATTFIHVVIGEGLRTQAHTKPPQAPAAASATGNRDHLRQLHEEMVRQSRLPQGRAGRRLSTEEIKAFVIDQKLASTGYQTAKEQFTRLSLQRQSRFENLMHEGEKAAEASGDLLKGFIYGKMAAQEQEVKHEQAHRLLLQRAARGAAHIEIEGAHTHGHTHGEGMPEGSVHGSPLGGVAKGGMHKMR